MHQEHDAAASSVRANSIYVHKNTGAGAASVLVIPQAALNPLGLLPLDFCFKYHHAIDIGKILAADNSKHLPA